MATWWERDGRPHRTWLHDVRVLKQTSRYIKTNCAFTDLCMLRRYQRVNGYDGSVINTWNAGTPSRRWPRQTSKKKWRITFPGWRTVRWVTLGWWTFRWGNLGLADLQVARENSEKIVDRHSGVQQKPQNPIGIDTMIIQHLYMKMTNLLNAVYDVYTYYTGYFTGTRCRYETHTWWILSGTTDFHIMCLRSYESVLLQNIQYNLYKQYKMSLIDYCHFHI